MHFDCNIAGKKLSNERRPGSFVQVRKRMRLGCGAWSKLLWFRRLAGEAASPMARLCQDLAVPTCKDGPAPRNRCGAVNLDCDYGFATPAGPFFTQIAAGDNQLFALCWTRLPLRHLPRLRRRLRKRDTSKLA